MLSIGGESVEGGGEPDHKTEESNRGSQVGERAYAAGNGSQRILSERWPTATAK